jgi:hypothetical protein
MPGAISDFMEAFMQIRKIMAVGLAAAVALAFSPLADPKAAPFAGNGSQAASSGLVHPAQAKTKAKAKAKKKAGKKKRKGKKAKSGKSCGTYMYRKGGKCLDARNKK